ncbi:uncharacterized protein LOC125779168 [Bactrocera dorsalis]|uniref:Uncharacterized protein LOC125779168 n=1 Tax=Bactrocera dorsalis TaxID=27457 RepID=A0A034WIR1_BACDO|nr:uncharacterized protein LOC125779168 [Bactrocera dorsalis]
MSSNQLQLLEQTEIKPLSANMSSSGSEFEVELKNNNKMEIDDISNFLVDKIKENKYLLEKSQLPSIKSKKKQAIEICVKEIWQKFGMELSEKNIIKKIANMKCRVKSKIDINKTGNKKIILKNWEAELSSLLCSDSNPSTNKLPVHLFLGTNGDNCTLSVNTLEETSATTTSETKTTVTSAAKQQRKRRCTDSDDQTVYKKSTAILSRYETDETRELNFQKLQRLVLLKQNKVLSAKLQILQEKLVERGLEFHE